MTTRVLVIDDERLVREMIAEELAEAGFIVSAAPDGPSALAAMSQEMPDAVVLDLKMPDMRGTEVLERLKALAPGIPVFVFSGRADFSDAIASLAQADGCFVKSADLRPLIRAIKGAFSKK
jgi:DNA-binding response OmpR family regulator